MNYILITPIKNEEQYLRDTINSVLNQTELPDAWVIIDGGSSDTTKELVTAYVRKYPWIYLLDQKKLGTTSHMNVSIAMKEAYEYIQKSGIPFEYVANIDADNILDKNFFTGLLYEMKNNNKLGAASGQIYNPDGKQDTYPEGEIPNKRMYRREALEQIGGYPVTKYSFDSVILAKLRIAEWGIKSFPEYKIHNLRKDMGIEHTSKIKSNLQWGRSKWYLGYSFQYLLFGCGYLAMKGEISKSIGVFFGWMDSWINHDDQIDDKEVWNHFHNERLSQILNNLWIEPRQAVLILFVFDAIVISIGVWNYLWNH